MIRFKKIFFFIYLLLIGSTVLAQDIVNVHLLTQGSDAPLEFAYVNVYTGSPSKLQSSSMTDEKGNAAAAIHSYPSVIEIVSIGYEMERITLQRKPANDLTIHVTKSFAALNEVVVTGVARPTKPQDALSLYKIITAATIQAQGAVNLQDALSYQLNTNVTNDQILGSNTRMQGLSGNSVKILIDGIPVNGREGGNIDLGQLNLYNAERVEMIQGPMSVVYGSDALGGVINIITKNNKKPWELDANAYYETVGKYNFNLSGSRSWGRSHLTLGGGRNYFQGWKYIDEDQPYQRELLFKPKEQYLGNFNYSYNAPSGFKIRFASDFVKEKVTNRYELSTYSAFGATAKDDYYNTMRSLNRLSLEGKSGKTGHWQMNNGLSYYRRLKNSYIKDMVTLNETPTQGTGDQDTSRYIDYTLRGGYDNKLKYLDYMVGYDIYMQYGNSQKIPGGSKWVNDYAAYITLSVPLIKEKLITQIGGRASYNTVYRSPIVPSLNILYHAGKNISLRASYARGFRAPSMKELYLDFVDLNHDVHGNPDLKAEVGNHIQASASWMVFEKKANYAQILLSGYYNDVFNQIALAQRYPDSANSNLYDYTNILRSRNLIANLEFEGQYSNFHYKIGYSFSHTFAYKDAYDAFNASELTTTFQYYWKVPKLNFSLFNKITGAQPALQANIDGTSSYNGTLPTYDMMNVSVEKKFWKQKIQVTAGVKNVWDVQTVAAQGAITGGSAHGSGDGSSSFLPRSFFTSLGLKLD